MSSTVKKMMTSTDRRQIKQQDQSALSDSPTLLKQLGGISGLVSSTVPILVLVPVNSWWGLTPALISALAVSLLICVWRLVRHENMQPAISGVMGVLIAAAIAWYVGSAKGYFLYGIWYSAVVGLVFFISCLVGWPAVGVIWRGLNGRGMRWRKNTSERRYFVLATIAWACVFAARFFVQNHLYGSSTTNILAVARIAMGWPLTILVMVVTVWAVRRADAVKDDDAIDEIDETASDTDE